MCFAGPANSEDRGGQQRGDGGGPGTELLCRLSFSARSFDFCRVLSCCIVLQVRVTWGRLQNFKCVDYFQIEYWEQNDKAGTFQASSKMIDDNKAAKGNNTLVHILGDREDQPAQVQFRRYNQAVPRPSVPGDRVGGLAGHQAGLPGRLGERQLQGRLRTKGKVSFCYVHCAIPEPKSTLFRDSPFYRLLPV